MRKPYKSYIRLRVLQAIHELHLIDVETAVDLFSSERVGGSGIRMHLNRLRRAGYLVRLFQPDDDPLNPHHSTTKRAIYLLGPKSYDLLGLKPEEQKAIDHRVHTFSAYPNRIAHELGIAVIHAALAKAHRLGLGELKWWNQGHTGRKKGELKPDATFVWNNGGFCLEHQHRARLESDTDSINSTEKKVRKYSLFDVDGELPFEKTRVLFVTRERFDPEIRQAAEVTLQHLFKSQGYLIKHHKTFFQVTSLTYFKDALKNPSALLERRIITGHGDALAMTSERATVVEPIVARHTPPS